MAKEWHPMKDSGSWTTVKAFFSKTTEPLVKFGLMAGAMRFVLP